MPDVIVIDGGAPSARLIAQVRARDDMIADAPVFAIDRHAALSGDWSARGADLIRSDWPDYAELEHFSITPNRIVPRLITRFGSAAIQPLLLRFRSALRELDGVIDDAALHRLAGHAGTLGYADLTAASERARSQPGEQDALRREVRKAIYDISQLLAR